MPKPIQTKAIPVEPTLSLGEKIRTWRQRGIAANATKNGKEASEGEEEFHVQSKMNTRKKINEIDFESPVDGVKRVIEEDGNAIHAVHAQSPPPRY